MSRGKRIEKPTRLGDIWKLTQKEFVALDLEHWRADAKALGFRLNEPFQRKLSAEHHEKVVRRAFSIGKPVPPEVLADYPDLSCREQAPEQVTKDQYK